MVELVNHGICPSLPSWSTVLGWLTREACYVHVEQSHYLQLEPHYAYRCLHYLVLHEISDISLVLDCHVCAMVGQAR
jgi:hypothetical protein